MVEAMNSHPRVMIHESMTKYSNPTSLQVLHAKGHKLASTAAIYGDHLLFNTQFYYKPFYTACKFVFVVRGAKGTLNDLVAGEDAEHNAHTAFRYYAYRLQRMCEMAKRTPGAVWITWPDIAKGKALPLIADYLGLDGFALNPMPQEESMDVVPLSIVEKAQDAYERFLFFSKSLNLRRCPS